MNDNDQDRTQSEGQSGIDRETEDRNRENETGEAKDQPFNRQDNQDTTAKAESRNPQGFVGSGKDDSSDYLTKGEQDQDFDPQGQGAQDSNSGRSDIETGQPSDSDFKSDDA